MKDRTTSLDNVFMKKILAISVSGLIATSAYAQDNEQENAQDLNQGMGQNQAIDRNQGLNQDRSVSQSQQQNQDQNLGANQQNQTPSFQEMDTDQDELLVWREIYVVMDPRIVAANLDQEQVFNQYDQNNDDALDDEEFTSFLEGLEQEELAAAGTQEVYDTTAVNGRTQTNPGALDQNDRTEDVQTGANQSVLRRESRYNEEAYDQATGQDQGMASTNREEDYSARTEGLRSGGEFERENGPDARNEIGDRTLTERSTTTNTRAAQTSQQQAMVEEQSQQLRQTPIDSLQDKAVTTAQGEKIGEVTDVAINQNDGTIGLIVESRGLMGIGKRKILAPVDELSLSDNEVVWHTDKSERELKKEKKYQPERYVEVSDRYETIDQIRRAGVTQR